MNKYFKAISANFIFFAINTAFFIAITPISIHVMGLEFFGLWAILNALVLLSGIGTLGISAIVNKFASEAHENDDTIPRHYGEIILAGGMIILPMAIITAFALVVVRNLIAQNLDVTQSLRTQFSVALLFVAAGIFPQFLARVPQGFLLSQLKNRLVRQIETVSSISLWLGAVLIAFYKKDLILIALWSFINNTLMMLVYFLVLRRIINFNLHINFHLLRRMMSFSGYMFIESTAIAMFQQLDRVIVGLVLGPTMAGVYSVGTSVGLRMSLITGQVTEVMLPYASLKDSLDDHTRLLAVFRHLSRYISLLVALIGGLLILWMPEILAIWISPDYASHYARPFSLLVAAYGLLSLCRPAHQALTGMGKVRLTSLVYLFATAAMLTAVFILPHYLGLLGAALWNFMLVFLLLYTFLCYRSLTGHSPWAAVFSDLKWGVSLPVLMLVIALFEPTLWPKMLWTVILDIIVATIIMNDDWARPWLFQQTNRLIQT